VNEAVAPRPPARAFLEAARPKTLSAAVAPVLVGTAAATAFVPWRFLAALVVALAVQVGVNFANDYYDAVRGVDTDGRVGPRRLVAAGIVSPPAMRTAMVVAFGAATLCGLALAAATSWWLVAVGAVCFAAAVAYSGGPRPYASLGLGEVFVFVFFGLVATVGSQFVQDERVAAVAVAAAVPVGLLAVAILVCNNLRDIPTDARAGKATLAVRVGTERTRALYVVTVLLAAASVLLVAAAAQSAWPLLALLAAPAALKPVAAVRTAAAPDALVAALSGTARLHLLAGVLLAAGLLLA
jgi:1,4-dihydroxy-2-naphthoate polyprenyltransferase